MQDFEKDFYKVLGVSEKANAKELRSAYHKLAKKLHPDRNPGNKESERRFKEVNEAYDILGDAKKRSQYDQMRKLAAGGFNFGPGQQGGTGGFDFSQFDFGKASGLGGISDIFEAFFKRGGGAAGPGAGSAGGGRQGSDVRTTVDVPLTLAARGGSLGVTVRSTAPCEDCGGSGGGQPIPCPQCHGTGHSSGLRGGKPCIRCGGAGSVPSAPCAQCGGRGEATRESRLTVKIPRGTRDGDEMRLSGQGNAGPGGAGALYLKVRLTSDRGFRLEGSETVSTVTVPVFLALLGTTAEVETLEGEHLRLKIPGCTQPGTRLRLRGKGLGGGDHLVEVQVRLPSRLTDTQRELLEQLSKQLDP